MREAIGNAFIVNLLLVFLVVVAALLIGSVSYSKAFKVKNRIIYTIEKYGGWDITTSGSSGYNIVQAEIETSLKDIGYHLSLATVFLLGGNCPSRAGGTIVYGKDASTTYHYCVYEFNNEKGHYYGVTTFMHFDIPLIGNYLEFPIYGETKTLYDVPTHFNH